MTLKQAAKQAIDTHNIKMIGQIVNQLRDIGFNYKSTQQWFARWGVDSDVFEGLMVEVDNYEANN